MYEPRSRLRCHRRRRGSPKTAQTLCELETGPENESDRAEVATGPSMMRGKKWTLDLQRASFSTSITLAFHFSPSPCVAASGINTRPASSILPSVSQRSRLQFLW